MHHSLLCSVLLALLQLSAAKNALDVDDDEVLFLLYSRDNPAAMTQLTGANLNAMDTSKPTKVIIHGFAEHAGVGWYRAMTSEFLKKGDYNVVQVDWAKPASSTYLFSTSSTERVGALVGKLLANLHQDYGLPLENIHIVGHSLGAHVAGYAGKTFKEETGKRVRRITALDAAGPLFEGFVILLEGLSPDDADVVDAIHTDAGIFGRYRPTGTVDFYPNGGYRPQPGCTQGGPENRLPLWTYIELVEDVFCSHAMSHQYFIKSINQEKFEAVKCDSWAEYKGEMCKNNPKAVMGDDYEYSEEATGRFFLTIAPENDNKTQ